MFPLYVDINASQDASTTLNREQTEFRIQAIPTYFDEFINGELISVFTNLSLSSQQPIEYVKESSAMDDDFDIISKFEFKNSKTIKARIIKTKYSPSVIID